MDYTKLMSDADEQRRHNREASERLDQESGGQVMCQDERCRHPYTCDCPEQCNRPEDRLEPVFRDLLNEFCNEIATESINGGSE